METIKRFEKAVFDLKQTQLKAPSLNGDKFSFRNRIYNQQNQKARKEANQIIDVIDGQFKWLNNMKLQLAQPNTDYSLKIR